MFQLGCPPLTSVVGVPTARPLLSPKVPVTTTLSESEIVVRIDRLDEATPLAKRRAAYTTAEVAEADATSTVPGHRLNHTQRKPAARSRKNQLSSPDIATGVRGPVAPLSLRIETPGTATIAEARTIAIAAVIGTGTVGADETVRTVTPGTAAVEPESQVEIVLVTEIGAGIVVVVVGETVHQVEAGAELLHVCVRAGGITTTTTDPSCLLSAARTCASMTQ